MSFTYQKHENIWVLTQISYILLAISYIFHYIPVWMSRYPQYIPIHPYSIPTKSLVIITQFVSVNARLIGHIILHLQYIYNYIYITISPIYLLQIPMKSPFISSNIDDFPIFKHKHILENLMEHPIRFWPPNLQIIIHRTEWAMASSSQTPK